MNSNKDYQSNHTPDGNVGDKFEAAKESSDKDLRIAGLEEELRKSREEIRILESELSRNKSSLEAGSADTERYFHQVTENVPAIIWITRPDGYCIYLNKQWYDYTGQTNKEGEGFGWLEATHPDDKAAAGHAFISANKEQKSFSHLYRLKNKDGDYRWAIDRGSPMFSASGEYEGMIGTVVDVHEERLANQAVKESSELFSTMADNIDHLAWMADEEGSIYWYNQRWFDYTGTSLEEMRGWGWQKVHHPDHVKRVSEKVQHSWDTGEIWEDTFPLRSRDGEYRWFLSRALPIKDSEGKIIRWFGTNTDIDEQRKAEEKIRESEKNFRELAQLMPVKISNASVDGNVIFYNQSWLDYTGLSMEELQNDGWTKVVHPDELEETSRKWAHSVSKGENFEAEFRLKDGSGNYNWHLSMAIPVKNEEGKIIKWLGSTIEIQKIKEEEQRKSDFIKMVSHELKTPVTSIKGYVQFLLMMLKEEQEKKIHPLPLRSSLVRIDSQIKRLTRLISEMLDLSKIEESKLDLKKELIPINELVIEAVEDIRNTSPGHTIAVKHELSGIVYADRDRIEQVIINLINNAIKYSPHEAIIDVRIHESIKGHIAVSIQDYGMGIDKADQQKIFERFYRVEGKSENIFGGFGIGLFIAKEIMDRHNGFISVDSDKGSGSVFTIQLPLHS